MQAEAPPGSPPEGPKPLPCPSFYATDASISTFPRDVMVVLLQRKGLANPGPGGAFSNVAILPVAELHMSLESFKLFIQAAAGQLAQYEREHGKILLGREGPPVVAPGSILQ